MLHRSALLALLALTSSVGGVACGQSEAAGTPAFGAASLDKFGFAIAQVGDLDGDLVPDLFVGAPDADSAIGTQTGAIHCRSGAAPATELGVGRGANGGERAGFTLARVGDVDGDGVEDVAVGAPTYNGIAGTQQGRIFILSGATFGELLTFSSNEAGSQFGHALASVGDRDGDGIDELLCGAPHADALATDGGAAFLLKVTAAGFTPLARFDGDQAGEQTGLALTALPDLDGDGLSEFALASPTWDGGAAINCGRVRLFSSDAAIGFPLLNALAGAATNDQFGWALAPIGDPGGLAVPRLLISFIGRAQAGIAAAGGAAIFDALAGTALVSADGTNRNEFLGFSLATVGDLDGDGRDDFALGAPAFSPSGAFFGGCVDVFSSQVTSGSATRLFRRAGTASQRFGDSLAAAGDVDGDGVPELLMGATGEVDPASGLQTGALHLLLGQRPKFTPDQSHYIDLGTLAVNGVGYGSLPVFVIIGSALSLQHDYAISFSSPWILTTAPNSDPFGAYSLTGVIPDLQGTALTIYAQAYLPYSGARHHKTLFSEVATIAIN